MICAFQKVYSNFNIYLKQNTNLDMRNNTTAKRLQDESIDEGLLNKAAKALGIKSLGERLDTLLGFQGDNFVATSSIKMYINQGANTLPTTDMNKIESALRSARDIKYGMSFFKDEPDLTKMKGSEEDKKIANYLIKRALYTIHSTSTGGHEFGKAPNIGGLKDSVTNRNLKHLKTFEGFNRKTNH